MEIDPNSISTRERYRLLIGCILPRPIALVSTQNSKGQNNLAPYSFFNGVSSNPPCLSLAIARNADGSKKDTLRNIEECKEFIVNGVHQELAEQVVQSAAAYPYGESEIERSGLTSSPARSLQVPRVNEALFHFECRLYTSVEVGDGSAGSSTLIVGEITHMHFDERIYQEGRIDLEALNPLSRLGSSDYGSTEISFRKQIPKLP